MGMKFTNFATSTLAAGITNVQTSLSVFAGDGIKFPVLGAGDYFYATLENLSGTREVIKVTARTVDSFDTIVRAQDGTTALAWNAGDKVELRLVSVNLNDVPKLDEANTFSGPASTFTNPPNMTSPLTVSNGGIGTNTLTLNNVLLGNGISAPKVVAPGTSGNVLTSDGTTWNSTTPVKAVQIQPISASVAANALTISASALSLDFRSTTLGSGTVTTVAGTPSNLVVPSTATLGTVNAVQSRLVVLALNNAGTIELAVINIAGGNDLTETGVITTTTISAAATANNVAYSTTGRTGVAYRVIGYIESTQTTAGTWATAPSTIQGYGGQALATISSLGYGQTWQNVAGSRAYGTTYYNTKGKPIFVAVSGNAVASTLSATVGGNAAASCNGATTSNPFIAFIVPSGNSYSVTQSGGTINYWNELS